MKKLAEDIIKKGEKNAYLENLKRLLEEQLPPDKYNENKRRIIDGFSIFWENEVVRNSVKAKTKQLKLEEVLEQEKLAREKLPEKPIKIRIEKRPKITYFSKKYGKIITRQEWTSVETVSMKNNMLIYFRQGYSFRNAVKETAKL